MAKVGGPLPGDPVVTAVAPGAGMANLKEGEAVSFNGSYSVVHTADGEEIHGQVLDKLVKEDGAVCAVVTRGVLRFKYTDSAPTVTQSIVGSATPGVVKAAALNVPANAARRPLVIAVDTAAATVDALL